MTARSRRGSGRRGGSSKKGTYWDGIQFPSTAIGSAGTVIELIAPTAQEFMPATMDRIRGHLWFQNGGSDADTGAVGVACKIMYLEINDAGTITGDHQGIDTHEEDIAQRQLWTYITQLPRANADTEETKNEIVRIEVDVRVSIKISSAGKHILALLADATAGNRANFGGYLRCHLSHG